MRLLLLIKKRDTSFVHLGHMFAEEILHVICERRPNPRNVKFGGYFFLSFGVLETRVNLFGGLRHLKEVLLTF